MTLQFTSDTVSSEMETFESLHQCHNESCAPALAAGAVGWGLLWFFVLGFKIVGGKLKVVLPGLMLIIMLFFLWTNKNGSSSDFHWFHSTEKVSLTHCAASKAKRYDFMFLFFWQSKEGKSPLHMAAIHGRFTRSQILIQNGNSDCAVWLMCELLSSPNGSLIFTPSSLFFFFFFTFPSGGEIDCVDKYGNTPLHVAAKYGHELLISTLMTNGADTARYQRALSGITDANNCVMMLWKHSERSINVRGWCQKTVGVTVLTWRVCSLTFCCVLCLCRRGIHGMFPLHLAVLYGFSDCCRKLLSSGLSP